MLVLSPRSLVTAAVDADRQDETDSQPTLRESPDPALANALDSQATDAQLETVVQYTPHPGAVNLDETLIQRFSPGAGGPPQSDPLQLLGRTLLGCKIESVISQVGTTAVFKARHLKLDRPVAVKVLSPDLAADQTRVDRFLNEARSAARIDHANLVALHDVDEDTEHGLFAIVMEYVEGQTLAQRVKDDGPLDPSEAAGLLIQACAGLTAAHNAGIVHRDIKPDNLLLTAEGLIKVTDFGLARDETAQRLTGKGKTVGTPLYMSPEQCEGQSTDNRSDLYSLGLVGYYLLTGTEPMLGDSAMETMHKQVNHQPPPAHTLQPQISPALSQVIGQMLSKDAGQRQRSAELVAEQLQAVVDAQRPPSASAGVSSAGSTERLPIYKPQRRSTSRQATIPGRDSQRPARPAAASSRDTKPRSSARLQASPVRRGRSGSLAWVALGCVISALVLSGGLWLYERKRQAQLEADKKTTAAAVDFETAYQDLMLQGKRREAFELLTQQVNAQKTNWKLRRRRIDLARDLGYKGDAIDELETLERLSQITDRETDTLLFLFVAKRKYEKASALVERVSRRKRTRGRQLALQLAIYLEDRKQYAQGLEVLVRAVGQSKDPDLLRRMIRLHLRTGNAVDAAKALLELPQGMEDTDSEQTYNLLMELRPKLQKQLGPKLAATQLTSEELQLLKELAERDRGFFLYMFGRALELHAAGDRPGAAKAIAEAVQGDGVPTPLMLQAMAALCLKVGESLVAARALLRVPPDSDPAPKRTQQLLRDLRSPLERDMTELLQKSRTTAWWGVLSELAGRDPGFFLYRFAAGRALLGASKPQRAVVEYSESIKLGVAQQAGAHWIFGAYAGRARAYLALRQYRKALADARFGISKLPVGPESFLRTRFHAQVGLKQKARATCTLTLLSWLSASKLLKEREALQKLTGSDKLSSEADVRRAYRVELLVVRGGGPLQKADLILACAGKKTRGGQLFFAALKELQDGKQKVIELTIQREKGKPQQVRLVKDGFRTLRLSSKVRILDKDS